MGAANPVIRCTTALVGWITNMAHRQLPWACWQEWEDVRTLLLGTPHRHDGSVTDQAATLLQRRWEGVNMVKAWRVRGKVPLSLDITAAIVEAQLQDQQQQQQQQVTSSVSTSLVSATMLRNQYALPIVRLVNGISDAQQRGRTAASVASLAQSAGLPPMLVDVRHAATHGELPSLAQLRLAAAQALAWLQAAYWDTQATQLAAQHARMASAVASLQQSWQGAAAKNKPASSEVQAQEDEAEKEDEPAAGNQVAAYSSAEGKQARKSLLSQLKSAVPAAWSAALLQPVAATLGSVLVGTAPPVPSIVETSSTTGSAANTDVSEGGAGSKRKRNNEQGTDAQQLAGPAFASKASDTASLKALRACGYTVLPQYLPLWAGFQQLLKAYPYLGHQLLALCVHSISSTCFNAVVQLQLDGHAACGMVCAPAPAAADPGAQRGTVPDPAGSGEQVMLQREAYKQGHAFRALLWWPQQLIIHAQQQTAITGAAAAAAAPSPEQQADGLPLQVTTGALAHVTDMQACLAVDIAWAWLNLLLPPTPSNGRPSKHAKKSSSVSKFVSAQHVGDADGSDDEETEAIQGKQQPTSLGSAPAAAVTSQPAAKLPLSLDAAQVVELLGVTLTALSAWHHARCKQGASSRLKGGPAVAVLHWLTQQLAAQLTALCAPAAKVQWGLGGISQAHMLLRLAQLLPLCREDMTAGKAVNHAQEQVSAEQAAAEQAQLLSSRWAAVFQQDRSAEEGASKARNGHVQSGARHRWQRVQAWQPCALGSLPAACLPSGMPSLLVDPCTLPVLLSSPVMEDSAAVDAHVLGPPEAAVSDYDNDMQMLEAAASQDAKAQSADLQDVDSYSSREGVAARQKLLQDLCSQVAFLC